MLVTNLAILVLAGFVGGFLPPSTDPEFLRLLGRATVETLAIATAGLFLAFCVAAPAAVLATRALSLRRPATGERTLRGTVRVLRVVSLPQRRGPPVEARACYEELGANVSQEAPAD